MFLLEARRRFPEAELWGYDLDARLEERWQAAGLGGGRGHLRVRDGLADAPLFDADAGGFDLVVGNPPYGLGMAGPRKGEPIEATFVRRFVALARQGGGIAVVVPEGIAANARHQGLRDWVLQRVALGAVVGLPPETFAATGTRARTVLLLARKGREDAGDALLASPPSGCRTRGALAAYLGDVLVAIRKRGGHVPAGRRRRSG